MSDVKKWDDINGAAPEPEKDESADPVKLKSHIRTMEDMLEQNDNQLDGVNSEHFVIPIFSFLL